MTPVFSRMSKTAFLLAIASKEYQDGPLSSLSHLFCRIELQIRSLLLYHRPSEPAVWYNRYLDSDKGTELDWGVHEVYAKGVIHKTDVIGQCGAVAWVVKPVDGVRDKSVKSLSGCDKIVDVCGESCEIGVKVVIRGKESVELIFDVLVEIDSGISVVHKRSGIRHDVFIALDVAVALTTTDVSCWNITDFPAVRVHGLEFLVEGNARGSRWRKSRSACSWRNIESLCWVVGAVCTIHDPIIISTTGRGSSSAIISVLIHSLQCNLRIFLWC